MAKMENLSNLIDPRWEKIVTRDPDADGSFVYSVRTTGVYCRPSCAARLARRENVAFHASCQDAEQAGFRPCKRCKPNELAPKQILAAKIAEICRLIEAAEEIPTLDQLAAEAGLSPSYFHRSFKQLTGVTPHHYARQNRASRVVAALADRQSSVTEAIYAAGFNSSGRFYDIADDLLGMTPSDFRAGGSAQTLSVAIAESSLGAVLVAGTGKGICAVLIGDEPDDLLEDLRRRFPKAALSLGDAGFVDWVRLVVGQIEEPRASVDLPLDIRGTAFQQRVWQALRAIPRGETATYSEIAAQLGLPRAVRAVAAACAANKIALLIPCHRVLRRDGDLAGYRWGVERKRALLKREAR